MTRTDIRIIVAMHFVYTNAKMEFSPGRANSTFSCWCLSSPNPFSQNFILRLRTILALFVLSLWQDFLKNSKLVLLSFSKITQVRRTAASMKCCFQGLGGISQQAKMENLCVIRIFHFPHLYTQMPCLPRCYCPVYKGLTPAFVYAKIKA